MKRLNQIYICIVFFFLVICFVVKGFISYIVVFLIVVVVRVENIMQVFMVCVREYYGFVVNFYVFKFFVCGMQQFSKQYKGI